MKNQQLQTLLQLQRQDSPAPDINVVIGEADNCTANPVVAQATLLLALVGNSY
jgi:hypothetical protein